MVQVYGVVTRKDLVEPNAKLVSHRPNLHLLLALQGSHCSDILDARGCPCMNSCCGYKGIAGANAPIRNCSDCSNNELPRLPTASKPAMVLC